MDASSRDEIQRLLREANMSSQGEYNTKDRGDNSALPLPPPSERKTGGRGASKELASLIGSLDMNIKTPPPPGRGGGPGYGEHGFEMGLGMGGPLETEMDELDFSVLRFGTKISLRSSYGRYLTAVPTGGSSNMATSGVDNEVRVEDSFSSFVSASKGPVPNMSMSSISTIGGAVQQQQNIATQAASSSGFVLGSEGQGVGEPLDCFILVNPEERNDTGPIRYGQSIALRVQAAKERYLGVRSLGNDSNEHSLGTTGFYRNIVGQAERWAMLPGDEGSNSSQIGGRFVRSGEMVQIATMNPSVRSIPVAGLDMMMQYDCILTLRTLDLLADVGDSILSRASAATGIRREVRLVHKEELLGIASGSFMHGNANGSSGDQQLWQVELFATQPVPTWAKRPYLAGSYLSIPTTVRAPSEDTFQRCFPGANEKDVAAARNGANGTTTTDLRGLPHSAQEAVLVRELLISLCGIEGCYIRVSASQSHGKVKMKDIKFVLDPACAERGLVSQATSVLPVCEAIARIRHFVRVQSRHEYGSVSHAYVAGVKRMLREFDVLVAQLDTLYRTTKGGGLSMQKLKYFLQPARTTLFTLDRLCDRLSDLTGGKLLDSLYAASLEQGDEHSRKIHLHLLEMVSKPFADMLSKWLFRGDLDDVYGEFMIMEDTTLSREALLDDFNAQYWEQRYSLREEHVPIIIQKHAQQALTAGKYLNVVRSCYKGDGSLPLPKPHPICINPDSLHGLSTAVQAAYQYSSQALLRLLEHQYGLISHLKSLQRFFLLENGDFFVQFMDTAEDELRRDVVDVALPRVQALLHLAVNTSTLNADPHRDDLSCSLASHNLIQHLHLIQSAGEVVTSGSIPTGVTAILESNRGLKGIEAFTLDYRVEWPVSILLSKRSITKYQLLSRLLFFSKHIEARVLNCWQGHQATKELHVRGAMGPSFCLRHRMLQFLQNFVYYMTLEVIGPRAHDMLSELANARDMDELLELHERFLDTCLKECLLASQELLKILTKIMTTCLLFADQMTRFTDAAAAANVAGSVKAEESEKKAGVAWKMRQVRIAARSEHITQEASHSSYVATIARFEETFDKQVGEFLERLWTDSHRHHPQLSNLCVRLDYNGFYSGATKPPPGVNSNTSQAI